MKFGERSQYPGDVTSGDDQGEPQRPDSLQAGTDFKSRFKLTDLLL